MLYGKSHKIFAIKYKEHENRKQGCYTTTQAQRHLKVCTKGDQEAITESMADEEKYKVKKWTN